MYVNKSNRAGMTNVLTKLMSQRINSSVSLFFPHKLLLVALICLNYIKIIEVVSAIYLVA